MSHYGLQVLYAIMNGRDDWACERVFTPLADLESLLREQGLPLVSLESFTPLGEFDIVGFSLQHELSATNVLTMLDLGGIPLAAESRTMADPLVLAGGPGSANPEPMARFIDAFVLGDGEEALPAVCDLWLEMRHVGARSDGGPGPPGGRVALRLRAAILPAAVRRPRPAGGTAALARRSAAEHRAGRGRRTSTPRRCPLAPIVPLCRVRSRADRHRNHAGVSVAVPLLPEPRVEASTPLPPRGNDRRGGPASLSGHGASRNGPVGALVERLPADRGAAGAAPRRLPAAGREHLDAEPAGQRPLALDQRPAGYRSR